MRRKGSTPAEYLAGLEGWQLDKVKELRRLVTEAAPGAEETVRSGLLYYEDAGDLFALAAQKHYVSLYVFAPGAMAANAEALAGLDCGKGCIRFRARTEVPAAALAKLLEQAAASSERDCHPA